MSLCGFTPEFCNKIMEYIFTKKDIVLEECLYLGVGTSSLKDDPSSEPTDPDYERQPILRDEGKWIIQNGKAIYQVDRIEFPEATMPWGGGKLPVKYLGIYDKKDKETGKLLAHTELTSDKTIDTGETLAFKKDTIEFELVETEINESNT